MKPGTYHLEECYILAVLAVGCCHETILINCRIKVALRQGQLLFSFEQKKKKKSVHAGMLTFRRLTELNLERKINLGENVITELTEDVQL